MHENNIYSFVYSTNAYMFLPLHANILYVQHMPLLLLPEWPPKVNVLSRSSLSAWWTNNLGCSIFIPTSCCTLYVHMHIFISFVFKMKANAIILDIKLKVIYQKLYKVTYLAPFFSINLTAHLCFPTITQSVVLVLRFSKCSIKTLSVLALFC